MKIRRETETGSIVSFNYDNEIAEITGLTTSFAPVQDLHGYAKPWAGGNGKNKLPSEIDRLKSLNTSGTWSGNNYTHNGITFACTVADDGCVTKVVATGTASATAQLYYANRNKTDDTRLTVPTGDYTLSGCPTGGGDGRYSIFYQCTRNGALYQFTPDSGSGSTASLTDTDILQIIITLGNNYAIPSGGLTFYPMLRLSSESADFAPYSNECPISGWAECDLSRTGINVWDEEWETGSIDKATGENITGSTTIRSKNYIPVKSVSYYFKQATTGSQIFAFGYDAEKNYLGIFDNNDVPVIDGANWDKKNRVVAIPSNVKYIRFRTDANYGATYKNDISINYPSTDTAYHAYNGNTYAISLGGTRYGGTLDVTSGVMNVKKVLVDLGTLTWSRATVSADLGFRFFSDVINDIEPPSSGAVVANVISSQYRTFPQDEIASGTTGIGVSTSKRIHIYDPNYKTYSMADFKTAMGGVQLVYKLAEPIEVQLAAEQIEALQGQNNVWANCGDITLSWIHAPVLSESVKLNGKYLEMAIDGYTTLGTSGRRSLGREIDSYSVGTADGETVKNSTFPSRKITVNYVIQTDTEEELTEAINQLANILNQDECDFVFRDEPDKYFSGYGLLDSEPKKYRHAVKGTWSLYCAYPFKRSTELVELSSKDPTVASVESHSATFVFDYKGTLPARPILRAEFASAKSGGEYNEDGDCGYVAFLDAEENIIQLGNPEVLDVDQYANATLINREFTSLSDWTASGVTVGDITDQFWESGKGQTQSYAKGTGSLTKSVTGAVDMEFDIVHRLCVSAANQTGKFECYAKNGNDIVVGFKIEKTGNGTTGTVSYILNNKIVGTDSIDLSYYNTHFGYCNRTARYVTQTYSVKETYYVKKKGKKKKKKTRWVTKTRQVQNGWNYTQSNLNSGWSKDGSVVVFSVGNLPDRTFKSSDIELTPSTSVVFGFTGSLHTNAVHSCAMLSKAGVPFAEIPNVFTAGDVVEGDCNSADVMLYRAGSLEGHLEPQYGALGNDWEDFEIKPGRNIIRAVWSDWVNTSYKPEIKIIFNEVYV